MSKINDPAPTQLECASLHLLADHQSGVDTDCPNLSSVVHGFPRYHPLEIKVNKDKSMMAK